MHNKKTICVDVDGTVAESRRTFEKCLAAPKQDVIDAVNKLYDEGHTIVIYTARSWAEYEMTEHWLKQHGVKFHRILMGKPHYDLFIDDKTIHPDNIDKLKIE
jgi:hydroxymethylpyrimidine pyrophosphatase-like HAD family hydrolase